MNWDAIGAAGEVGGAIAVVVSVLYLAFQVRQNTVHSRAYSQRDMLNEITGDILRLSLEPQLFRGGLSDFEGLSDDDKVRFAGYMVTHIARFEANLRLHRSGLMDQVLFDAHRGWALTLLTSPGAHEWWQHWRRNFSQDVREFLDDAMERGVDLPGAMTDNIPFYRSTSKTVEARTESALEP